MQLFRLSLALIASILIAGCSGQDANSILEGVQELIDDSNSISKIYTIADGTGPNGTFQTKIWSAREGFVRFEQRTSTDTTLAGINESGGWTLSDNEVAEIDLPNEVFLHGHELHLIALDPLSRFENPVYTGETTFNGQKAVRIQFQDKLNNPVNIYYESSEYLPLGMEIKNPFTGDGENIQILFEDWKQLDNDFFFFTRASFLQGGQVWSYVYSTIEVNKFDNTIFNPESS